MTTRDRFEATQIAEGTHPANLRLNTYGRYIDPQVQSEWMYFLRGRLDKAEHPDYTLKERT